MFTFFHNKDFRTEIFDVLRADKKFKVKYNDKLFLVKYNRDYCDTEDEQTLNCRGIIAEKESKNIVCYPMKGGLSFPVFREKIPITDLYYLEESIDGTLVNLFYYNDTWNVSTKGCIDARHSRWLSEKSFYTMFYEACKFDVEKLNKTYCYSFVLAHQDNRIVTNYESSDLYLVHVRDMNTHNIVDPESITNLGWKRPNRSYDLPDSYEALEKYCETMNYNQEGIMLYTKNGQRTKLKSTAYVQVKNLKNNFKSKRYTMLSQMLNNTEVEYLQYFTEENNLFQELKEEIRNLVNELYSIYMNVHVSGNKMPIEKHLRPLIYNIHGLYLEKINKNKKYKTTKNVIRRHLMTLDTSLLYYILSIEKKRNQINNQDDSINLSDSLNNTKK